MKERKIKLILGLSVLFLLFTIYNNLYAEDWKTFESKDGYILDYPSDWVLEQSEFGEYLSISDNAAFIIIELVPEYLTDVAGKPPTILKREFVEKEILENIKNNPDYNLLSVEETKFNNKDAIVVIYTSKNWEIKDRIFKNKAYRFIDDSFGYRVGYELIYKADEESFDKYLSIAEKIMRSFRITEDKTIRENMKQEIEEDIEMFKKDYETLRNRKGLN